MAAIDREMEIYQVSGDVTSYGKSNRAYYARHGDLVRLISDNGNVWIMEDGFGYRFPCSPGRLTKYVKPTNDANGKKEAGAVNDGHTKTPGTSAANGLPPGREQQLPPHAGNAFDAHQRQQQPPADLPQAGQFPVNPGPAARKQKGSNGTGSAGRKKAAEKPRDQGTLFGD